MNKSYKQVKGFMNCFCNEWIKSVAMRTFQGNWADRNVKTTSRVNGRFYSTLDTDLQNLSKLTDRQLDNVRRIVCNETKYCHITPLLADLHWLPVKFRIEFKILLNVFN